MKKVDFRGMFDLGIQTFGLENPDPAQTSRHGSGFATPAGGKLGWEEDEEKRGGGEGGMNGKGVLGNRDKYLD